MWLEMQNRVKKFNIYLTRIAGEMRKNNGWELSRIDENLNAQIQ